MADNLNPFLEEMDDDFIEDEIERIPDPAGPEPATETISDTVPDIGGITLDIVAAKLLKDNFILTALELHTELVESGRELPRLRDFFSNPSNFERLKPPESSPPGLPRTSSCQTFDSLDFARYSDDGDRQENDKVAVLEFELRKAQEMIKSLRATLTKTAETELSTPESPADQLEDFTQHDHIREYERRALNFLVNEYMLTNNYKLTSVTFAEENEDQDFEDWDDVGLNMPKPPSLLHLYRDYAQHTLPIVDKADFAVGVNLDESLVREKEHQLEVVRMELTLKMGEVEDQLAVVTKENLFLTSQLKHMEREIEASRLQKMSSSTPACSPITTPSKKDGLAGHEGQRGTAFLNGPHDVVGRSLDGDRTAPPPGPDRPASSTSDDDSDIKELEEEEQQQQQNDKDIGQQEEEEEHTAAKEGTTLSEVDKASTESPLEEADAGDERRRRRQMVVEVNGGGDTEDGDTNSKLTPADSTPADDVTPADTTPPDTTSTNEPTPPSHTPPDMLTPPDTSSPPDGTTLQQGDMSEVAHSLMVQVGSVSETPDVTFDPAGEEVSTQLSEVSGDVTDSKGRPDSNMWQPSQRNLSESFKRVLLSTTFHAPHDTRIVSEVSKITDSSGEKVVLMLARCIPHIVPNVLLAKREELIPLILCTASLHPDPEERDRLLNILFNLIKRPDLEQRQMILTGCVAFAQHVGPTRVETELLPQCWEQINHRFAERRLLVAEACGALSPYLPSEMRSSLVLSMLVQMLHDDKMDEVRESVVRSLGLLIGFVDDADRYPKVSELLQRALNDSSDRVVRAAQTVFLPSFAMWASERGLLETDLIHMFVTKLEDLVKVASAGDNASQVPAMAERARFVLFTETLTQLVPALFASVLQTGPFAAQAETLPDDPSYEVLLTRLPKPPSALMDLSVIVGDRALAGRLVHVYEEYIGEEWYEPWETYIWVAGEFIPQLLNLLNTVDVSSPTIVSSMTQFFLSVCRTFGRTFALSKIKPKFHSVLNIPEDHIAGPTPPGGPAPGRAADSSGASSWDAGLYPFKVTEAQVASGQTALTKCTVPVYVAGILAAFNQEGDRQNLTTFLQDLLCTLSLCHASLDSLRAAFTELSLDSGNHDLLLTVLWDGVVHTSAHVRTTAAKMFELLIKGVSELLVSTRVIPALVTLASDPEISVRIATVPAFGTIMESVTQREMLDKVHMQFMTFMDDPMYKEQHALHVELIRTFAKVGPNAEPRFRDDFVLPRLAIIAANNQHTSSESRRLEIATQLFDTYSALSCCFISDQLVEECMLPGLRALHGDMQALAPTHAPIIASMIKEFEDKVDTTRPAESPKVAAKEPKPVGRSPKISLKFAERSGATPTGSPQTAPTGRHGADDVRSMISKFKGNHPKFSSIFKKS